MRVSVFALTVLLAFIPLAAGAQTEIGLPPQTRFSAGLYGSGWGNAPTAALLGGSVYRDVLNPAAAILGVQGELYGGMTRHGDWAGHAALGVRSPVLALGAGLDVALRDADVAAYVSLMHPLRRGGLLGRGSLLHASLLFGGESRLRAGLSLPLGQPLVGNGRPRDHTLSLRAAPVPRADRDELYDAVLRMHDVIVPPVSRPGTLRVTLADRSAVAVIAAYHDALDRGLGRAVADSVRAILLDSLLLPHNRLLGRKRYPDDLTPFAAPTIAAVQRHGDRATAATTTIIRALVQAAALQRERHGDERLVWLPLQYGLRAEQYASQAQLDALIERATAGEFSDSNQVVYVNNEQFAWELFHSIRDAREYHVLWVHTFRGVNDQRTADAVSFRHVAHSYLAGLIDRVRRYDRERVLPDFQIIVDQFYFEQNRGRIWMPLLQDPLGPGIRLRNAPAGWQSTLDSLQRELRSAVAGSRLLQTEAQSRGERWLRDRVSVHVHITQQADPSFFSADIIPIVGLSDNALRDHRKIVFYDLAETDPYRGAMIISGMGVGEEFSGEDWEDRAAIIRGTVAHTVKRHAARVLTGNGLAPDELPVWLQDAQDTVPLAQRAAAPRFDPIAVTALQVHNDVGYGEKQVTVATAMLYSLLPDGAVVKSANALFLNPLWASLLLGHALRGGQVLLMSASRENSPFKQPEMSLAAELLAQLLVARDTLAPALARTDGMLRVGVYDVDLAVDDVSARIDTALARRARTPWLQELEPFSREVVDSLRRVAAELRRADSGRPAEKRPKMHMKAQFVASREAWENLFVQPGWGSALASYFRDVSALAERRPEYADFHMLPPTTVAQTSGGLALRREVMSQQSERDLYYLMLGSFNQDYRSALLDGEAMILISQFGAAVGIADFVLLPSLSTWVESAAELQRYMPTRVSWFTRALRRLY